MKLLGAVMVVLSLAQVHLQWPPDIKTQKEVQTQVEIRAPAPLVWKILTEFSAYDIWNPYIYPVHGDLRSGGLLDVTLHTEDGALRYQPAVLVVQPEHQLSWGGRIPVGMFERVQTFTVDALTPDRVRVTAKERFQGYLLPLYGKMPDDARRGLEAMTRALRDRAELLTLSPKR
jgi:hypothetical protein